MNEKKEPFNLPRALSGEQIFTKDGRKVSEIKYFSKNDLKFPVFCSIDGSAHVVATTIDGKDTSGCQILFMSPKHKIYFVNFYLCDKEIITGRIINDESESKNEIKIYEKRFGNCIKTISLELPDS